MDFREVTIVMSTTQIKKTAFKFQMYEATKSLFRAVHEKKHIVLYGPHASGKTFLVNQNEILLKNYARKFYNFDDVKDVKRFLKEASESSLLLVEALYDGEGKLSFPLDNVRSIFMEEQFVK